MVLLGQEIEADHATHRIFGLTFPAFLSDGERNLEFNSAWDFLLKYKMEFRVVQPSFIDHFLFKGVEVQVAASVTYVRLPFAFDLKSYIINKIR